MFSKRFIDQLTVNSSTLVFQEEEVQAIKLVSLSEFKILLENSETNGHFVASNYAYYLKILDAITSKSK